MGLNSEIHLERTATRGAGTDVNMPRTCWDIVGWRPGLWNPRHPPVEGDCSWSVGESVCCPADDCPG